MEKFLDVMKTMSISFFGFALIALFLAIISKSKSKSKKVVIILDVILLLIGLTGMIIQFFYSWKYINI